MAAVEATLQSNGQADGARPPLSVALHVPNSAVDQVNSVQGGSAPLSGNPNRRSHIQQNVQALPRCQKHRMRMRSTPLQVRRQPRLVSPSTLIHHLGCPEWTQPGTEDADALALPGLRCHCLGTRQRALEGSLGATLPSQSSRPSIRIRLLRYTLASDRSADVLRRRHARPQQQPSGTQQLHARRCPAVPLSAVSSAGQSPFGSIAREAEEWRKAPAFKRSEVNLTKLEETEGVIALASQWIELDSPDEGCASRLRAGAATGARLRILPRHLETSSSHRPHPPGRRPFLADYARAINHA